MPSLKHPKLRVAAVQAAPVFMDIDATIDKTIEYMTNAANQGCDLVAFPETWVPGYPWWIWLTCPAEGMKYVQKYFDNSMQVGSEEFERLSAAAKELGIHLSLGFSERCGGSLYIAQALFSDKGEVLKTRRKLKPTHVERTVYGDGDGSDIEVIQTSLGNIGMLACWEHLQPLTRYAMYSQHEQIHIGAWPSFSVYKDGANALSGEVNNAVSLVYAVEGGCFVVAPCAIVSSEMQEELCINSMQQQLLQQGGGFARIYGPDGTMLGTPLAENEEGLVIADIDLSLISLAKAVADPAGHYARPDVTRLLFNNTPGDRVVSHSFPEQVIQEIETSRSSETTVIQVD